MQNEQKLIGQAIKVLRGKRTQQAFAQLLGVDSGSISRWETGKYAPDYEKRVKLAELAKAEGLDLQFLPAPTPVLPQMYATLEQVYNSGNADERHVASCDSIIEATEVQICTPEFADWLKTTHFAGQVEPGEQWDTEEAWPSRETMRAARECYRQFHAGDLAAAASARAEAELPFV